MRRFSGGERLGVWDVSSCRRWCVAQIQCCWHDEFSRLEPTPLPFVCCIRVTKLQLCHRHRNNNNSNTVLSIVAVVVAVVYLLKTCPPLLTVVATLSLRFSSLSCTRTRRTKVDGRRGHGVDLMLMISVMAASSGVSFHLADVWGTRFLDLRVSFYVRLVRRINAECRA